MEDLRSQVEAVPAYPPVLFFHHGTSEEGERFFADFWPEARAVSDPSQSFFDMFDVPQGSLREILGPGVWLRGLKAMRKGHSVGRPIGDVWRMPAILLVRRDQVLWSWKFKNVGDHPDFSAITAFLAGD